MLKMLLIPVLTVIGGLAVAFHSPTDRHPTENDLAAIRGAETAGCMEQVLYNCANPYGFLFDSTCVYCTSVDMQYRQTTPGYPDPNPCPTSGTAYKNYWYKQCMQAGPNNNYVCTTPVGMECYWPVTCTSGAIVQDKKCDASNKCTVAAPPQVFQYNGETWEMRHACRDCATGAPASVGLVSVAINQCVPILPPGP